MQWCADWNNNDMTKKANIAHVVFMAGPFCVVLNGKLKRLSFFSKPRKLFGCQIHAFVKQPYRRYVILD